MTDNLDLTEKHYFRSELFEDICSRLKEMDVNLDQVQRKDIAGVDEFHVRGVEVTRELAQIVELKASKVLDVGCGIGGPCRLLADEFDCEVTGIDLSEEFIRTASKLSELVGLSSKTNFVSGNATSLPFEASSFDLVWTQHVQMNVEDKEKFYSEINRVLRNTGSFLYYDIFRKGDEKIDYPMPWANSTDISFLAQTDEVSTILDKLGLKRIETNDQSAAGIAFFEKLLERIGAHGPPKLGLNVLMGETTKVKIMNLLTGLKTGKLELQSGVYTKA